MNNWYSLIKISFPVMEGDQSVSYFDIGHSDHYNTEELQNIQTYIWIIYKDLTFDMQEADRVINNSRIRLSHRDMLNAQNTFGQEDVIALGRYEIEEGSTGVVSLRYGIGLNEISTHRQRYFKNKIKEILDKELNNPIIHEF